MDLQGAEKKNAQNYRTYKQMQYIRKATSFLVTVYNKKQRLVDE